MDTPFERIIKEMLDIHRRKNSDYTGDCGDHLANFRLSEKFGVPMFDGILVRLSDKYSRITSLVKKSKEGKGAEVKDESLRDTLIDLANYAIIAITAMEEKAQKGAGLTMHMPRCSQVEFDLPKINKFGISVDPDDESWNEEGEEYDD